MQKGDDSLALGSYRQALKIYEKIKSIRGIAATNNNIGLVYLKENQYNKAERYFLPALDIQEKTFDQSGARVSYVNLAIIYAKTGAIKKADLYARKGLKLVDSIGSAEDRAFIYSVLYLSDSAKGNFRQACEDLKRYHLLEDSFATRERFEEVTKLGLKHSFDKKADSVVAEQQRKDIIAKNEIKKQQLIRNSIVLGLIGVVSFLVIVYRQRNKIAREKKRSEQLLLNILPEEVADELKKDGIVTPRQFENVTVLFTDFVNFTQTSEMMSPHELIRELNVCFGAFDKIISKYKIEKIKTIGDAYMAVCGLPIADKLRPTEEREILNAMVESGLTNATINGIRPETEFPNFPPKRLEGPDAVDRMIKIMRSK